MHNIPILVVGGAGTRLRPVVSSVPKPLAPLGDCPFLELLVRQLRHYGIRRLVMCTGYLRDQIETEFGDGSGFDVSIVYSKELVPMETAGALKLAKSFVNGAAHLVVMNGDSFLEVDCHELINFHRKHSWASEYGSIASAKCRPIRDRSGRFTRPGGRLCREDWRRYFRPGEWRRIRVRLCCSRRDAGWNSKPGARRVF